jgi:hypothetical protein
METTCMSADPASAGDEGSAYSYRPSLLGAAFEFKMSGDGLDFVSGRKSGHVPFRNISRMRMSYKPTSMQSHRFLTEIWAEGAPKLEILSTSWKSMVEQERRDKPYAAFVAELNRRVAAAGATARFEQGTSPFIYWPGVTMLVGVSLGLAYLAVHALQSDAKGGALFIAAFLALFLWYGGDFFRRNRPGKYRPGALPTEVMPKT